MGNTAYIYGRRYYMYKDEDKDANIDKEKQ